MRTGVNRWMLLAAVVFAGRAEQLPPPWADPAYQAGKIEVKQITVTTHYRYRQFSYDPPVTVDGIPKSAARYSTPEEAFISRVSAMMAKDYDWWLGSWDARAKEMLLKQNKTPEDWAQTWSAMFGVGRASLIHRIEFGSYVILTYKLVNRQGQDVGGFEFPSVYHKVKGNWVSTQDLMDTPLLPESPWVSGKNETEVTIQ